MPQVLRVGPLALILVSLEALELEDGLEEDRGTAVLGEAEVPTGHGWHRQARTPQFVSLLVGVQRGKPHQPVWVEAALAVAALVRPHSVYDVVGLQAAGRGDCDAARGDLNALS